MAKNQATTIAIGKNKGHKTTKIQSKTTKPGSTKGRISKRTGLIRQVINQVAGVAGYEKRVIEFLKAGSLKDTKRALKVTKKALGTHRRAKNKRENLMNLLRAQQAKKKWLFGWCYFANFSRYCLNLWRICLILYFDCRNDVINNSFFKYEYYDECLKLNESSILFV